MHMTLTPSPHDVFFLDMFQWWRWSIGCVLGNRCKYGAGRRRGLLSCVWLFEKTASVEKRTYRKCGKCYWEHSFARHPRKIDDVNWFKFHSQEQYKFVYDTLEEHIKCGKTWFPVAELSERLKAKARKDPATKMNEYQREYAQICKQTPRQVRRRQCRNQHLFSAAELIFFTVFPNFVHTRADSQLATVLEDIEPIIVKRIGMCSAFHVRRRNSLVLSESNVILLFFCAFRSRQLSTVFDIVSRERFHRLHKCCFRWCKYNATAGQKIASMPT